MVETQTSQQLLQVIFHKVNKMFKFNCPGLFTIDENEEYHTELTDDNVMADPVNRYVYQHMDSNRYKHKGTAIEYWSNLTTPEIFDIEDLHKNIATHPHFPHMLDAGLTTTIAAPLIYEGHKLGILCLNSTDKDAYTENHKELFKILCDQIAISVHNIQNKERQELLDKAKTIQLNITKAFQKNETWESVFTDIAKIFSEMIQFDSVLFQRTSNSLSEINYAVQQIGPKEYRTVPLTQFLKMMHIDDTLLKESLVEIWRKGPVIHDAEEAIKEDRKNMSHVIQAQNSLAIPMLVNGEEFFIVFCSENKSVYNSGHIKLFRSIQPSFVSSMEKALLFHEVQRLNSVLAEEKNYLKEQVSSGLNSNDIIGESHLMKKIKEQINLVGPTYSSVLIQGKTGTGKEVVARVLHEKSQRKDGPMIKVNCASLPPDLIESELFGHEKGAFTGAIKQRKGKFELADGGTLFLDEIGEMPLSSQPKLLRAIQEKEFERVGGSQTIKVDVRIIAATNISLEEAIKQGTFRSDLYYRLSVFPINLPTLHERDNDIELLSQYFVHEHCKRLRKKSLTIGKDCLKKIKEYHWPGNIRELSNVIERSVLLSHGSELNLVLTRSVDTNKGVQQPFTFKTHKQAEKEHLLETLKRCNGKIRGEDGAAVKLQLAPSTLEYRIKRAGITKKDIYQ